MALGQERKQVTKDSLAGSQEIEPAVREVRAPAVPDVPVPDVVNSVTSRLAKSLQGWSTKKLTALSDMENEQAQMDGQIAYMQGKSLQDVGLEGNKWAMEGFNLVNAQTASSTITAANMENIKNKDYELSPDQFREKLNAQFKAQMEQMDPNTRSMLRERLLKQAPALIQAHTTANLRHVEKQNYDAVVNNVDLMSRDDAHTDEFLFNFSGDKHSPTASLSESRRISAMVDGVVRAFSSGNPKALQKIKTAGLYDQLSIGQKQKLEKAEAAYQGDLRKTFNASFMEEKKLFHEDIATGKYSDEEAVDRYSTLLAKYGMKINEIEQKKTWLTNSQAQDVRDHGDHIAFTAAMQAGDVDTAAKITERFMVHHESRGNKNALGPVIKHGVNKGDQAEGEYQVMPKTADDPGFGIKPSDGTAADTRRVGAELWGVMFRGKSSGHDLPWEAGDVEAAAIAYNAGHVNAKKWIEAGRDYSVLPKRSETEPYAKGILAMANGTKPMTAQEYTKSAIQYKADISKRRDSHASSAYAFMQADLDEQLKSNQIDAAKYKAESLAALYKVGVAHSEKRANHIIKSIESAKAEADKQLEEQNEVIKAHLDEKAKTAHKNLREIVDADAVIKKTAFESAMAVAETPKQKSDLLNGYVKSIKDIYSEAGFELHEFDYSSKVDHAAKTLTKSMDAANKRNVERQITDDAASKGQLRDRSDDEQAEFWDRKYSEIKEMASKQDMPDTAKIGMVKSLEHEAILKAGTADPRKKADDSTVLMYPLMSKDGKISPEAVGIIDGYANMKEANPWVAETMLTDKATLVAENVLKARGSNKDTARAITNIENGKADNTFIDMPSLSRNDLEVERSKQVSGAVQSIMRGRMGEVFSRSWTEFKELNNEKVVPFLTKALEDTAMDIHRTNPNMPIDKVMAVAAERVDLRTSVIGGNMVVMPPQKSLRTQMFPGDEVAYSAKGIENDAIVNYLSELAAADERYAYISDYSWLEAVPGGDVLNGIANLVGMTSTRAMGVGDTVNLAMGGVRPFQSRSHSDGGLSVRVMRQDGNYSEDWIKLDLRHIGELYKSKYGKQAVEASGDNGFVKPTLD
mgnify:CR=1 FL=1